MTMNDDNIPRPTRDVEIASTRDGIDITRGYTGPLLVPADRVLRQRGGNDLAIYEQVLSEPQVMSTFQQRRNAVVKCEWTVEPASERRIDKKAADHLRAQLQRVGWDRVTDRMLFGVFYGYAVAEMLYGVEDGLITWDAIKVRNRRRFRFAENGDLRMLTMSNMFEGVALPPAKFWHFATGADNDDEPYGLGLGHWCYWPTLFKRNGIKFWLTFIEKFAAPTGVGRYEPTASQEDQNKLLAAVQAIRTDSGIIFPKGMEVELLEAARSGSVDYKALHDTMDETIAKVTLGQTMTSQDGSSMSQAKVHMDVRQDLVRADADLVCESLNLGPVRWLTRWNFPDADPPRVFRVLDEPEDLVARANRDKAIRGMGFRPTLGYIHATYGGEWTEDAPPADPLIDMPPPLPAFAAPDAPPRDRVDQFNELLTTQADPAVKALVERARRLVNGAGSLEAIRDALPDALREVPLDQLTRVMQDAMAAANLAGQSDAGDDSA
jgi:phage gp29-like protein